jgi:xanthine/CO dehydrogenase XdhC/CoxF family maturation factor
MKEINEILERVAAFDDDERAILATVIDVRGSGYRLPGARMLILPSGETCGTVSGGCLEADVLERAKRVLDTGRAEVFVYDTTNDEGSVFSLNMGCRGVIRILLESVGKNDTIIETFRIAVQQRERQTVATLIDANTGVEARLGGRTVYRGVENFTSEGLPDFLVGIEPLHDEIESFYYTGAEHCYRTLGTPEGSFEFALENIQTPISVMLFGAGADAVPFVRIAAELGWQVTVHDHRAAFLDPGRFPAARDIVLQNVDEIPGNIAADSRTAAVIMTHNYTRDRTILPDLLRSEVFYLGALGPKRRTEQLLEEITLAGHAFSHDQFARLFAPAGLDIGADSPESIALSIIGEIQAVLVDRGGGHLRSRRGSIYDRR